jgi:hypothetical protein
MTLDSVLRSDVAVADLPSEAAVEMVVSAVANTLLGAAIAAQLAPLGARFARIVQCTRCREYHICHIALLNGHGPRFAHLVAGKTGRIGLRPCNLAGGTQPLDLPMLLGSSSADAMAAA